MSILQALTSGPLAKALGWALVHFLWEGAVIALLIAVLLYLCGPRPARLRYAMCCLALLAMPVVFGVTLALTMPAAPEAPPAALVLRPVNLAADARFTPPAPKGLFERLRAALPWAVPFWIAGVLLCYLRSLAGWMAAQRLRRTGVCLASAEWQQRLHHLRHRIRVSQPVVLLESCLVDVPVVIGFVRPAILMPLGLLLSLPTDQLEAILLHELAHIRRGDYLVNVMQNFVEGLLFYHPAVWWVSGLVRSERENCCDDAVVQLNGDARAYAAALATLENSRWPAREPALAATGGSLMKRIQRLLQKPERPRPAAAPVFAAGLLVVSIGMAAAGWQTKPAAAAPKPMAEPASPAAPLPARPQTRRQPTSLVAQVPMRKQGPPEALRSELETPYRKWMNEDVAYIITDEERAAFKRLENDEEREQFIGQFWRRRDPTPGTAENEMKEEHYRRIAYANERYAASIPGWKTDRGRIYISYGPAAEIESHPSGGKYSRPAAQGGDTVVTYPFEQWRYPYIEGVGTDVIVEFVDPERTGEYRMTMDPTEKVVRDFSRIENFARLQRPPQSAPTGRAGATVQMMNNAALVSIPLSAYGNHGVNVRIRVLTSTGRMVTAQQDSIQGPAPLYTRFISLQKGVYRVVVEVMDATTGAMTNDELGIEVK